MIKKLKRVKYRGYLSGITGDLSGIVGYLDDCKITKEERNKGIKIEDLII